MKGAALLGTAPRRMEPALENRCNPGVHRLCVVALALFLVACTTSKDAAQEDSETSHVEASKPRPVCPVTFPDGDRRRGDRAGVSASSGMGMASCGSAYGLTGRVRATKDNVTRHGAIFMKFPWDRAVKGRLRITGRRIDADAPPLRALLSDYRLTGFQPSTLIFPDRSCREITGRIGERAQPDVRDEDHGIGLVPHLHRYVHVERCPRAGCVPNFNGLGALTSRASVLMYRHWCPRH